MLESSCVFKAIQTLFRDSRFADPDKASNVLGMELQGLGALQGSGRLGLQL